MTKNTKRYIFAIMKDSALQTAIDLVGGQKVLAGIIGTTQPTISRWQKAPAEMVLAIEAATGGAVKRYELRPDIYPVEEYRE